MCSSLLLPLSILLSFLDGAGAFWGALPRNSRWNFVPDAMRWKTSRYVLSRRSTRSPLLMSGYGKATKYNWTEEAFEIEVTVGPLPRSTLAKNIKFSTTPTSVDLRYLPPGDDNSSSLVLLDGSRKLRGRIHIDGTFWAFADVKEDSSHRYITVRIEKNIKGAKDDFDVVDYDWKGVYLKDENEVKDRYYDKPEELNIREYAASMGVDIDNINMSMVDKTMFTSGLNLTQTSLDQLSKAGLVNEVTVQSDGSEYVVNPKTGEPQPFPQLGTDIGINELKEPKSKIPFLDTNSPWSKTVPVEDIEQHLANKTLLAVEAAEVEDGDEEEVPLNKTSASDPIDGLTVKRLKEILKSQGLGVVGNKKALQERLRKHVKELLLQDDTERSQS